MLEGEPLWPRTSSSVFAIAEQDLYPLPGLGAPMPIARRTCTYLSSCL
jgi:hypothetical protein